MTNTTFRVTPKADQTAPAGRHYTITPGASELSPTPRALYVNAAGNAVVEDEDGTAVTYADLTVGMATALVDIATTLNDETDGTYYTADRVHLTDAGHAVVASAVQSAIDAL